MSNSTHRATGTINVRGVPLDLRHKFKAAVSQRGKSMQGTLIELMRDYVKANAHTN